MDGYIDEMKSATLANYVEIIGLLKDDNGKINWVTVRDKISNI